MRIWGKIIKDNRLIRDTVVEDGRDETRTHKVTDALREICARFDIGNPIWLDSNINEFKRHAKVKFRSDSFIEAVDFDYLEMHVIEE